MADEAKTTVPSREEQLAEAVREYALPRMQMLFRWMAATPGMTNAAANLSEEIERCQAILAWDGKQ